MTTPADQPADLAAWLRRQLDVDESNSEARIAGTIRHLRPAPVTRDEVLAHNGAIRRELAEVDAKRRILDLHTGEHECSTITYQQGVPEVDRYSYVLETEHCTTVLLLALPYAARPGYRDEWRP